jgi:hypothetical protein
LSRVRARCTSDVWETYERISFRNESVSNVSLIMNIPSVQVYDRVSHIRKLIRIELAEMEAADS